MSKIALIIYADTETAEAMGRLSNAFIAALEAIEDKDDLKIIFEGAGTKWIPTLENEKHKMYELYLMVKPHITGACDFCAQAFGVKSAVEKAGIPLIAEYKQHPSLGKLVKQGFQIITF